MFRSSQTAKILVTQEAKRSKDGLEYCFRAGADTNKRAFFASYDTDVVLQTLRLLVFNTY